MSISTNFMGATEECVADFAKRYSGDATRPLLAEFCKVTSDTVGRWLNGRNLPAGDALLRLRAFLSLIGYRVNELDDIPRSFRRLGQCIAVDVLSPTEVQQELDYSQMQEVYRVVLRGSGLVAARVRRMEQLLKDNDEAITTGLRRWESRIEDVLLQGENQRRTAAPAQASPEAPSIRTETRIPVSTVAHLLQALDACVGYMEREGTSAVEDRQQLREMVGEQSIKELSEVLARLLQQ